MPRRTSICSRGYVLAVFLLILASSRGFAAECIDPDREAQRFRNADLVVVGNVLSHTTKTLKDEMSPPGLDGWMYRHRTIVDIYRIEIEGILKGDFSDSVIVIQTNPYNAQEERHRFDKIDEKGDSLYLGEIMYPWGRDSWIMSKSRKYIILIQKQDTAYTYMLSRPYTEDRFDFFRRLEDKELQFSLVYQEYLPIAGLCSRVEAADLLGSKHECVIIESDGHLLIYQYREAIWDSLGQLRLVPEGSTVREAAWTVGDLDDDGRDEIIVCTARTIRHYRWTHNQFSETSYELAYFVDDILVGDVDNDSLNELVLFCYENPLRREDPGCRYHLCIAHLHESGLNISWTDKGELGYVKSNVIPSDNLVCIGDIENAGHSKLVVAEGQSDLSPTRYNLLIWNEGGLRLTKSFIVAKGTVVTEEHIEIPPWMTDDFRPMEIGQETLLLGSMVHSGARLEEVVGRIVDGNLEILEGISFHEGSVLPNRFCWINADGKGKGVLGIPHVRNGENKYVFYRSSVH